MVIMIKVHHYHHCIVHCGHGHCGQPGLQRRSLQVLLGQSSPCLPAVHSGAEKDDDGDDDDEEEEDPKSWNPWCPDSANILILKKKAENRKKLPSLCAF